MQGNDAKAERRRRAGMRLGAVSGLSSGIPALGQIIVSTGPPGTATPIGLLLALTRAA